ncbi:MAG: ribonuclease H-like YkuK family protein [Candidatus Levybacteria bacterium]|nr:ribonuclease H-like YkuK family protein [Candidatus Levybacteria bacterium]
MTEIKDSIDVAPLGALIFQSITHGQLTFFDIILHIKSFLEENPQAEYSLVIGTDSQERKKDNKRFAHLVTAVVVHRKGHGGKYFWHKEKPVEIHSLREKIYAETLASLDLARTFVPILKNHLNGHSLRFHLEIHVDVGEFGDTREMIKEIVGMVTGNGFVAKTKPEAYGASYVADKHT